MPMGKSRDFHVLGGVGAFFTVRCCTVVAEEVRKYKPPSIPHLKRRTVLWPTPPFVIESGR
jgi:hypothetical protein